MANSRPESMVIPPGIFDEKTTNNISQKQPVLIHGRSSSSSIDSANDKNLQNSLPQTILATTSSATTDSDSESEQYDKQQKIDISIPEHLSRRVRHFYKLFKSEIPEPMPELISSYVCAYQGDILLQGKMYITDRYLCFHSRIINYVTKHVYRWEQIESVRKERVAFIFPTAICIKLKQTGKKIIYASFLQRDQAYEKILSIWSTYTSEINSYDDDNDLSQDATLKANNRQEKLKDFNRDTYDIIDQAEQDVLQMCLKQNQKRASSVPKNSEEKNKKLTNSLDKRSSLKTSKRDQKSSKNQTTRHSRYAKNEQKLKDTTKRNNSSVTHRSDSASQQSHDPDRTDETLSHSNSSSTVIPNTNSPIQNTNSNGIFNIILSVLNQIKSYMTSYSMKIIMIIFLILTILFLHSFYLIKLTYQIENRLESLHNLWPSSSVKNSFSSNTKEL